MQEMHDAESATRLIAKVIRDMTASVRFDSFADFKDTLRRRLTRLRIAYDPADFDAAVSMVASNRELWGTERAAVAVAVPEAADPPLTRADAVDAITRIREQLHRDVKIRSMERVRQLTPREIAARVHRRDRERALRMITDAIADVAARCDALERKP